MITLPRATISPWIIPENRDGVRSKHLTFTRAGARRYSLMVNCYLSASRQRARRKPGLRVVKNLRHLLNSIPIAGRRCDAEFFLDFAEVTDRFQRAAGALFNRDRTRMVANFPPQVCELGEF